MGTWYRVLMGQRILYGHFNVMGHAYGIWIHLYIALGPVALYGWWAVNITV